MTIVMVLGTEPILWKESEFMAKRRSFVPGCAASSSLEGRVVLSTFGSIGNWFSSQYHHVTDDLGITHKSSGGNASAGILKLWQSSNKPTKAVHAAPVVHVTSDDTVTVK